MANGYSFPVFDAWNAGSEVTRAQLREVGGTKPEGLKSQSEIYGLF